MRAGVLCLAFLFILVGCGGGSNTNTTTPPPPVPPTVTGTTPGSAATGVAATSAVTATFSAAMNASSITATTFTLTPQGGSAATGNITYSAATNTATFTPIASLNYSTQYTATITTGVTNSAGTALAANYSWIFTTAAAPAPTVTTVSPATGSTGVAITTVVTAAFNEAMNASSIIASTFTLTPQGGAAVSGTVAYSANTNTATFTPNSTLAYNTQYTATITTGVTNSSGMALAANYSWTFTTAAAPAPTVTAVSPTSGATSVAISTAVTATFSLPMNSASITASTFTLTAQGGAVVGGAVSYSSVTQTATFDPTANLAYGTTYAATITTGATSSTGAALAANYSWSFSTPSIPSVANTTPANNATSVPVGQALIATFSQPMNSATITSSTFTLTANGSSAVSGTVSYNAGTSVATFTPNASLANGTQYTATITSGATSSAGVPLASNYVWTFTTVANPNQVTVNFGMTYQTVRGFGGSTAWLGALTSQQATALFNQANGLGLSILRVRIDPEGSPSSSPAYFTSEWSAELTNAQEAMTANSNAIVFASPWTPPISMKASSTSQPYYSGTCSPASNYCGGYLNPSFYAAYTSYLEDFITYFANNGVNLYAISMQNEPDYANVNYESTYWNAAQMDTWVAGLTANGATYPFGTTKLIMPESFNFNFAQSDATLNDASAVGNVSIVGGHLYGATPAYYTNAESLGKDVWMTEHTVCQPGSNCPTTPAISDALALAEEIHNSMTVGYYNAYVYWWIWDDPSDGVTYGLINSSTGSPAPTYYGYAIGQFSKFIQPGYVRVAATANPSSGVYISAYTNASPAHYVIVVINSNSSSVSETFTLNNGSVSSVTPYQTTSTGGLLPQTAVSISSGQFTYTLPAQSIVTFMQ